MNLYRYAVNSIKLMVMLCLNIFPLFRMSFWSILSRPKLRTKYVFTRHSNTSKEIRAIITFLKL